jgi:photosystem II stability/assembly factor-like uncharacterized protein
MFCPAISPVDPSLMMVNCDMSAAYITTDGGRSWRMIHRSQLHSSTRCRPAFHPSDPEVIYAADAWDGMKVSRDRGERWEKIGEGLPGDLRGEIAIDSSDPRFLLAGAGEAVHRSEDAGRAWKKCDGPRGEPLAFHFVPSRWGRRACFAGTSGGVWRSDDGGSTWALKTAPATARDKNATLPDRPVLAFAGGTSVEEGVTILYVAFEAREEGGRATGGIYRSMDRGETWAPAMGPGLNVETKAFDPWAMGPIAQYRRLATTDARPRTVYAFNSNTGIPPPHHATVFRSDDAGDTWRATFQADPRYPGLNVELDYTVVEDGQFYQDVPSVAIDSRDPDRLVLTDGGRCHITTDGGKTWACGHTRLAPGAEAKRGLARWLCTGLVVTTTWNYYIDPFEPSLHSIAYTDIGFARSPDGGKTWAWWALKGRSPWGNTCYELAFDPETPGKVWGAFSNVHDIPNDNIISGRHGTKYPGGVCVSTDHGATWKPCSQGLPPAATTGIAVDPRSPKAKRTLYAGVFGHGVYRSADGGETWAAKSEGLGAPENRRVCRIALHPDGTLFALITALREGRQFRPEGVGLYASRDGGERWTQVNASRPLLWPKDFTVDPADSRTIYVGAADARGDEQGGLYRTTDGGATWRRLARKGPETFGGYLHPKRPGWIYMTLTEGAPEAGLWLSKVGGESWRPMDGLPFSNAQRVLVDPGDPDLLYVTTFGGSVWRGPASE